MLRENDLRKLNWILLFAKKMPSGHLPTEGQVQPRGNEATGVADDSEVLFLGRMLVWKRQQTHVFDLIRNWAGSGGFRENESFRGEFSSIPCCVICRISAWRIRATSSVTIFRSRHGPINDTHDSFKPKRSCPNPAFCILAVWRRLWDWLNALNELPISSETVRCRVVAHAPGQRTFSAHSFLPTEMVESASQDFTAALIGPTRYSSA